ncbi:hypothetical protein DPMN_019457 [Dreissena polymorpha]|uniref:Uncharacterized protein n=1 Tax=Dreissena polymorpha TaxID=45954 RepID=A0A9D4NIH1_DREPO|nr:hypothetical protein DPMN_019457 [Dreissena polymorpha]
MHVYLMELHILSGERSRSSFTRSMSSYKVKHHIGGHCISQTHLVTRSYFPCFQVSPGFDIELVRQRHQSGPQKPQVKHDPSPDPKLLPFDIQLQRVIIVEQIPPIENFEHKEFSHMVLNNHNFRVE